MNIYEPGKLNRRIIFFMHNAFLWWDDVHNANTSIHIKWGAYLVLRLSQLGELAGEKWAEDKQLKAHLATQHKLNIPENTLLTAVNSSMWRS